LLPQTWEDPSHANSEVEGCFGDNDPGKSVILFHVMENLITLEQRDYAYSWFGYM